MSLLKNPGSTCPAEIPYDRRINKGKDYTIAVKPCGKPAVVHGFCNEHRYLSRLLLLADEAGYPEVDINECYHVEGGVAVWDEVILRVAKPGQWFGFTEKQAAQLRSRGRADRYTQVVAVLETHCKSRRTA